MSRTTLLLYIISATLSIQFVTAQSPDITWQKCFGGSGNDYAMSVKPTGDNGFIIAGYTTSKNGDVTGYHQPSAIYDFWVLKLDSAANVEWQKCLGGTSIEEAYSVQQAADGGYIIAGYTGSTDGDVTDFHGGLDFWLIKLSSAGELLWQKAVGHKSTDAMCMSMQLTRDGGYILAGYSYPEPGNAYTGTDFWVVKLDSNRNIQWEKRMGGSQDDEAHAVDTTRDGGYIVAGFTRSNNGDVTLNRGFEDYWIVKLDSAGNMTWQKTYGGSIEDMAFSVKETPEIDYVICGWSNSDDMDVPDNANVPYPQCWIVKLNSEGNFKWGKSYGGSKTENGNSIQLTPDGGYLISGKSYSNDGDLTENNGDADFWVIKLDTAGNIQWQKSIGGKGYDMAYAAEPINTGGYIIAGSTSSPEMPGYHSDSTGVTTDFFVVRLGVDPAVNVKDGLWSDSMIWRNHKVPDAQTPVYLNFNVTVDKNAQCNSIHLNQQQLHVNKNITLLISGTPKK